MSRAVWIALAAVGGFGLGVFVAKNAYESKVRKGVGDALDVVGLKGGTVNDVANTLLGVD